MVGIVAIAALWLATPAAGSCALVVKDGWVRTAPPGAMMLAGYATLVNTGDSAVTLQSAESTQFADASMHETYEQDGLAKMRPLESAIVPAHGELRFAPGGRHFMLMRPTQDVGAAVSLTLHADCGDVTTTLAVRDAAP